MNAYATMTTIGELFGVSSHSIGKWLAECGLRNSGRPTQRAFSGGFVAQAPTNRENHDGYFYVWHKAKTVAALEAAGHRLKTLDTEGTGA